MNRAGMLWKRSDVNLFCKKVKESLLNPYFGIFSLSLLLVVIWFFPLKLMGGGESGLPFYNLGHITDLVRFAWTESVVGNVNGIVVGSFPFFGFFSLLNRLVIPGFILEAAFFLIILFTSGVSVYKLTNYLFPKVSNKYLLLSTLFYWFNPISLVNVWNRFLYNFMAFFAFFPLAVLLYIKGVNSKRYVYAFGIGLLSFVFSYALTDIAFTMLLWFVFLYTTIFYLIFDQTRSKKIFNLTFFFLTLVLFVLINFWWISQTFSFVLSSAFDASVSNFFNTNGNLDTFLSISSRLGNLGNLFRLIHNSFYYGPSVFWATFYTFTPSVVIEFLVSIIIFLPVFLKRKNLTILFMTSLFIIGMLFSKGVNQPFGEIFAFLFAKLTILQVFRNPFEKFGFLIILAASPLFALGVYLIASYVNGKKSLFAKILLCGLILFYSWPFITGFVFTSEESSGDHLYRSLSVSVPPSYKETNDWLNSQNVTGRLLVLPIGGEGISYKWANNDYAGVELSNTLFDKSSISLNTTIPFYNNLASSLSFYQLNDGLLNFLPFLNSEYLIWRGDIDYQARNMANPNTTKQKIDGWVARKMLSSGFQSGSLAAYRVNSDLFWSKIFMTPTFFGSNGYDLNTLSKYNPNFPKQRMAIVNYLNSPDNLKVSNLVVEPDKIFSPQFIYDYRNLTDKELAGKLFYVSTLPTNKLYLLIKVREMLQTPPKSDYRAWITYKAGILGKRAVEVHNLIKDGASKSVITKAENDYIDMLSDLEGDLSRIIFDSSDVSQVVRDSLLYQDILLNRVRSGAAEFLTTFLAHKSIKPEFELPKVEGKSYIIYDFNTPRSGKYNIKVDQVISNSTILIDGENADRGIELSKGVHEVALLVDSASLLKSVTTQDTVYLKSYPTKQWDLNLPDTPTTYKVSFDYKFTQGNLFGIQFNQDISFKDKPLLKTNVIKDRYTNDWRHWEGQFTTLEGATLGKLIISQGTVEKCNRFLVWSSCFDQAQPYEASLRGFKIEKLESYPEVSLTSFPNMLKLNSPTQVSFTMIDPTRYRVQINKLNPDPEILVFSELFNPNWQAKYNGEDLISPTDHLLVNDYANGWMINKAGSYTVTLEFTPQKLLDIGKVVSAISIGLTVLFMGVCIVGGKHIRED